MDFTKEFENINLESKGVRLPDFIVDDKYRRKYNFERGSNTDFLARLVADGFNRKILNEQSESEYPEYQERIDYELKIIEELGFTNYFLLVWDVINFCRENNIPTSLGRGSSSSSVVLYLIGVTQVDPLKYELYFERFISKTRAKKTVIDGITYLDGSLMPDVDIDVCYYRRHEVLEYLERKFKGKSAKIITFSTLSGKLLIKECGKIVSGKSETEMNHVSEMIPKVFGIVQDIKTTKEGERIDGKWKTKPSENFSEWCDDNIETYKTALKLRGLIKNKSVHASGVAISFDDIYKNCPTELSSDKEEVSSYSMNWVLLYNVKLDILGLKSASVVQDCLNEAGLERGGIDLEDGFIYQNLQFLKYPKGLFQLEADTNFRVCRQIKPKNLKELTAVVSIARPGALRFAEPYSKFSNRNEYFLPDIESERLKEILKLTGGCLLYQETVMKIAHEVFQLSLEQAELIRKATGKKNREEMQKFEKIVYDQGEKLGIPKSAKFFWDTLSASADYLFPASHGVAYSSLSALTVYLKFKYPKFFFLSLLRMARREPNPTEEISKIQSEMRHFGISLLPPHIMKSNMDFSIEGDNIRYGLLSIKGISDKSEDSLNQVRMLDSFKHNYNNKFEIFQGAQQSGITLGVMSALIQAGALDIDGQSRTKIVYEAQLWSLLTKREKNFCLGLGEEFNFDLVKILKKLTEFTDEKGKVVIPRESSGKRPPRLDTIKKKAERYKKIYQQNTKYSIFANYFYEQKLLGYSFSTDLRQILAEYRPDVKVTHFISDIFDGTENSTVNFVGKVEKVTQWTSKKKTKCLKMEISDNTGRIQVLAFGSTQNRKSDDIEKIKSLNDGKIPKEGMVIKIIGKKKNDCVFSDTAIGFSIDIFTKLAELKENS